MTPTHIGPYRLDRELGSGGMGKVYAATAEDGRAVALKVLHPHLLETPGFFERFLREAQVGQAIRHDNVVRTLGCGQELADGTPQHFLVMEYVEGQTLAELQRELERVPEELCRHVGREVCKGLAAIHGAGVVHRDLKPENVIISRHPVPLDGDVLEGDAQRHYDHVVKVMDLGVALVADEALRLSRSGVFVGSVEYAAPEQFKGGAVYGRTDLHALGLLLYELSSGMHPYRGGAFHEVLRRVCNDAPRRLGEVNPQLSAFFEEVVHTLLAKDPRDRFTSAAQLLGALDDGEDSAWWHERARLLQTETRRPLRRIRIPRETAVYGRERELERLRMLYERANAGQGQVVLIEGEAGIGKSRLVDELITRLTAGGADVNFLFGSYPPGGAATASGAFSSAYREHLGESGCAEILAHLRLFAPAFDALLQGGAPPAGAEPLTKESLQACFVTVTRSLAAERPTVVLIDDLHFAPDEGRALFTALAMAAPGSRLLLVGTTRPGLSEEWIAGVSRLEQASRVPLERLSPKDLVELLQDSFRSTELASALAAQIAVKSDGNPFFAFEIIRGLREGQFIAQGADGTWASTRVIDEIKIPSTVLDLVNARVADLTEEERDLLDVGCCVGFEFDPGIVGDVLGVGRIPVLKRFGQIERKHRLVRAAGRDYVFDHHQVQEALYGSLHEQMREEYHAALAEALEARAGCADRDAEGPDGALCVDLCEHYLKGARGESALRYLEAAQAHLAKCYLNDQMVVLTERALTVPGLLTGTERARALLRLADAFDLLGRRAREEDCVREAEALADEAQDDDLRGRAANALGRHYRGISRLAEAEAAHRRALDIARDRADPTAEARATGNLGVVIYYQGRLEEAKAHSLRALALSREIGDRVGEAGATGHLGLVALAQGRHADAQAYQEQALALTREIGDRQGEEFAAGNLGLVHKAQGRLAHAQEYTERYLALSREIGDRRGEAYATGSLGNLLSAQGRLSEAQEHCMHSLALAREIGDRSHEASVAASLGYVLYSEGRLAQAREHFERHLELSRETGRRRGEAIAHHNLGVLLREMGESEQSEESHLACRAVSEATGHRHLQAATRLALGSLRAARSRERGRTGEEGRELLEEARNLAEEHGFAELEVIARCELALLPGGNAQDALASFVEFEERLEDEQRREALLLLWNATGDPAHLVEAKRLLDAALRQMSAEFHDSVCRNRRVPREILAAWRAQFGDGAV